MGYIENAASGLFGQVFFLHMTAGNFVMVLAALVFLYLAVQKGLEPLFLLPFSFGILLINSCPWMMKLASDAQTEGKLMVGLIAPLLETGVLPLLILAGLGAMMDFTPLIANPDSFLFAAAVQFGICTAFLGAAALGIEDKTAAVCSLLGSADSLMPLFLAGRFGKTELMGVLAAVLYLSRFCLPKLFYVMIRLLTTKEEQELKMEKLRPVSKTERLLFPVFVQLLVCLLLPSAAGLVGMLMLGNLVRETEASRPFIEAAFGVLMNVSVFFLGFLTGLTADADVWLKLDTLKLFLLTFCSLTLSGAFGILLGKLMCKLTGGRINPLIGAAGAAANLSAVRVVQRVNLGAESVNTLLPCAMGANTAALIGTLAAAGVWLTVFGAV